MTEELAQLGNPSSLHNAGRRARRVVEESREQIAEVFGARASEVVFTSGGTEADNLAVKGLFWARRAADGRRKRVLTTAVEHHAVLDSVRWLADAEGALAQLAAGRRYRGHRPRRPAGHAGGLEGRRRRRQHHVGEQRGRHGAAGGRAGLGGALLRGAVPHRRGAGRRADPGGLRRVRRGCPHRDRAQDRRSGRGRRAHPGQEGGARPGAARRRPGARHPVRDPGRPRHPGLRRRRGRVRASAGRPRPRGSRRCATT